MVLKNLTWPDTWTRRFVLAMSLHQPVLFLASVVAGWIRGMTVAESMSFIYLWAFVTGLVISLMQASGSTPGASFWRPFSVHERTTKRPERSQPRPRNRP